MRNVFPFLDYYIIITTLHSKKSSLQIYQLKKKILCLFYFLKMFDSIITPIWNLFIWLKKGVTNDFTPFSLNNALNPLDGAYYCYCAYVLRISIYSDFPAMRGAY